jgi:hypothetical protein
LSYHPSQKWRKSVATKKQILIIYGIEWKTAILVPLLLSVEKGAERIRIAKAKVF